MFEQEFDQDVKKNEFVLLGWAEVGFVYVFTNTPVRTPADMNGVKMWMWEGDAIAEAAFRALGINPIPLSVVDVLTSLQTGLINGAYTSPLAALVLSVEHAREVHDGRAAGRRGGWRRHLQEEV